MKKVILSVKTYLICSLILMGCSKKDVSNSSTIKSDVVKSTALAIKTISFSGYTWYVKSGTGMGPGPKTWNENNVWVDALGKLHMQIKYSATTKKWECSEIWTTTSLGFGKYEWFVEGRIDLLDKNVVVGLFNYPTSTIGPDGTNEIDIEFAKWGNQKNKMGNFTVWPAVSGYSNTT